MKNRFLSLMLLVVMVASLIPATGALAAGGTTYLVDDFEGFTVGDIYTDSSATEDLTDDNGDTKWSRGKNVKVEVVSLPGVDGKTTKALRLSPNYANPGGNGVDRLNLKPESSAPKTGVYVMSVDIYAEPDDADGNGRVLKNWTFGPFRKYLGNLRGPSDSSAVSTFSGGKWTSVTVVVDLGKTENNTLYYVDGELLKYNAYTYTSSFPGYLVLKNVYSSREREGVIIDNVNFWYAPDATTLNSDFADSLTVAANSQITVSSNNPILEYPLAEGSTLSLANVKMTKSSGSEVKLSSVMLDEECKTLTIDTAYDLDKGETYSVELKGLVDEYGRVIEDYTFSFTTADDNLIEVKETPKFVKQYLFQPGNTGVELRALENGYISASHTVRNNSATRTQEAIIVCVLKENAEIKYFQFKTGTLTPGEELTFNGGFNVDNAAEQSIEIYVWDTMSGMTPLAEKYTINKNGITPVISE